MTNRQRFLIAAAIAFGIMTTVATAPAQTPPDVVLTNVSYDPTRELYRALNDAFPSSGRQAPARRSRSARRTADRASRPVR